jgi:hypothetical protein
MKTKSRNIKPHKNKIQTSTHKTRKKNGPLSHTVEKKQGNNKTV